MVNIAISYGSRADEDDLEKLAIPEITSTEWFSEHQLTTTVFVGGMAANELSVEVLNGRVTIHGLRTVLDTRIEEFEISWQLAPEMDVVAARFEDGRLFIDIERRRAARREKLTVAAKGWFLSGAVIGLAGLTSWIVGELSASYVFQLVGSGVFAIGTVAVALALIRGEQIEHDLNGA